MCSKDELKERKARISHNIKVEMYDHGIRPEDVAKSIGITTQSVYYRQQNRSSWKAEEVLTLCEDYNLDIGRIIRNKGKACK